MSVETQWLANLIGSNKFFTPCSKCGTSHSAREATLNFWDIEAQEELCSICLMAYPRDNVIQVRRSSYHDVVKVADVSRLADISGVQSYVINGSKVLFLRRRPQPRPPKGAVGASQCTICSRHLQDVNLYCSLQCKLDSHAGIKHVSLRAIPFNESRSTGSGPETPSHLLSLKPIDTGSDSDSGDESRFAKRRKGYPHRSPWQ